MRSPIALWKAYRSVVPQRPIRIVGDLPHISIRIGKCPGIATPDCLVARPHNLSARAFGLGEKGVDLMRRPDVVG